MALIDTHRPPEGNAAALRDRSGKLLQLFKLQTSFFAGAIGGEWRDEQSEVFEARGMRFDKLAIDPFVRDEKIGKAIKEHEIGFRPNGKMLCGGHRGFSGSGIHHQDLGIVLIAHDPLPHDGMGEARISLR